MKEKLHSSNAHYKEVTNEHKWMKVFEEDDIVMVHIRKKKIS